MINFPFSPSFSPYKRKPYYPSHSSGMLPPPVQHCANTTRPNSYIEQKKEVPKETSPVPNDVDCFELFGFKFYFDDLLILAMLFFLYKEESKDSYLFIALFLLLMG